MKKMLTVKDENGYFCTDERAAIERLGKIEEFYERLCREQEEIGLALSDLRSQGKAKSVKFNQLLAKKLTNVNIIAALEACF